MKTAAMTTSTMTTSDLSITTPTSTSTSTPLLVVEGCTWRGFSTGLLATRGARLYLDATTFVGPTTKKTNAARKNRVEAEGDEEGKYPHPLPVTLSPCYPVT